jgi:hypothetical protein
MESEMMRAREVGKPARPWRRPQFELVAVALVLVAVIGFTLWPRPWPTAENFARLRLRMTQAEVEAIVGPPGDFSSQPNTYLRRDPWWQDLHRGSENTRVCEWLTDVGQAAVFFDAEGRVVDIVYRDRNPDEQRPAPAKRIPAQKQQRPMGPAGD